MKNTKSGFTLPELLIVVAIIAVLVAIAIPVFSAQLESSKQASDLASIRDAYAEAAGDALLNGGKDGVAETGLMKHTGLFSRLGEAHIGNLDLKTNDADPIVKDYTVMVTVSAVDGSVKLNVGNGGHLLGKTVTADEIQALKDEFHKATNTHSYYNIGYRSTPYTRFWTNGNTLTLYHPSYAGGGGTVSGQLDKAAEYGVPMVLVVNDDGNIRRYFEWDGACWYMTTGAGGEWVKVDKDYRNNQPYD